MNPGDEREPIGGMERLLGVLLLHRGDVLGRELERGVWLAGLEQREDRLDAGVQQIAAGRIGCIGLRRFELEAAPAAS